MLGVKCDGMRIPELKIADYQIWKVMLVFLEATDPNYIDMIYVGPYKPTKIMAKTNDDDGQMKDGLKEKPKKEWTKEYRELVIKYNKVMNILHSGLDSVMSTRVINCKTSKEIWDALEIRCQGTTDIKENMRVILVQEYEAFEAKSN